jgi:sulfopyruvate decarboxylase TPP-binding subunit
MTSIGVRRLRKRVVFIVALTVTAGLVLGPPAFAAPNPISVSPSSVANDGSKSLTITGSGFVSGATVKLKKTGQTDIAGTGVTVGLGGLQITGTFNVTNAAPGTWNVVVTNPDSSSGTCADCLTITAGAPTVTSANPNSRGQGATSQSIAITGTNFAQGATASFSGTGITVNSTTWNSSTSVTANINVDAAATTGQRNVTVTNTDLQSGTCNNCFTVNAAPAPTSTTPSSAANTGNANITINGSSFQSGATVLLRRTGQTDIPGTGVVFNSSSSLKATFNLTNAAPGAWTVRVTNPDAGTGSCACFTVSGADPTVTVVSPSSRGQGATNVDLTIEGTHFAQGAAASFSGTGITVNSTEFVSSTEVTANITITSAAATTARNVTVTNTDTQSGTCTPPCFTVNAKPTVTSADPSSRGQGATGQDITINGTGFVTGAPLAVTFSGSGITVNSTEFVSGTELTVNINVSSAAATGARDVTVTNGDAGVGTCAGCFTVNAKPTVLLTTPSSRGQGAIDQAITVSGVGFVDGDLLAVSFSGTGVTVDPAETTFVSSVELTIVIDVASTAATGTRSVTVVNGDGGVGSCSACFTVNAKPVVTSAVPSSRGQGATGEDVTINGSGFVSGSSLATSFSGTGITVNSTTFESPTELTANITVAGGATVGARDVTVTNGDAGVGSCTGCFSINAKPTITPPVPSSRGQGATDQNITITGTGFVDGAEVTFEGTGITVNSTEFVSPTELIANIDITSGATTGARDVIVTNPDGATPATCTDCFTINAKPTVTSADPASRGQGAADQDITINGSGFVDGDALDASFGNGITVNGVTFVSAGELTVNISVDPAATTGTRNIAITNGDAGVGTCSNCFTVNSGPAPTGATPPAASNTGTVGLTIAGSNFVVGPPASTVVLRRDGQDDIVGTAVVVSSSSSMTATFDLANAAPGTWSIVVTNPDGGEGSCDCFTIAASAPTVTSATPSARGQGTTGEDITVAGTNFAMGATASFSGTGITVNSTTWVSPTELTVNIDVAAGATPGARNVTVTNTDTQSGTCTGCFTVQAAPTITSTNPSTRGQGATNQNITVNGTGFLSTATATFNGTGITTNSTTFVSATQLTVNVDIATNAPPGAGNVTVDNHNGGSTGSCSGCFTVASPTVTSASPSSRGQGATNQNITITGNNFVSGSTVSFSGTGITINSTTFVSVTSLTVNIDVAPAAAPGTRSITVSNGVGSTAGTCNGCFTVTVAPSADAVFPDYSSRGVSGRGVLVLGSGFDTGTTVSFSGTGITVNAVDRQSNSVLIVTFTISSTAAFGPRSVTVKDSKAGVDTCVDCFTVTHFDDVGPGDFAFDEVETIADAGITTGCSTSPSLFCPDSSITRGQMAVFLLRAMGHAGHLPAYRGIFADVPASNPFARYIEHLYDHGVTSGCATSPRRYCPDDSVTRGQMAVFLLRAIGHAGHLPAYRAIFADVPASNPFARYIEHLYDHGITGGCATNPLRYCPNSAVTRAQMAVFLVRAFAL